MIIEMKKLLLLIGLIFYMISCAPYESTPTSYKGIQNKNKTQGFKYFAEARPYSNHKDLLHGYVGSSTNSQQLANETALEECIKNYSKDDCFLYNVGDKYVWEENIAHIKAKEEEEKKNKELAEQRKKEESLLASINLKRGTCTKMGFESETEGMANCVLQLMLEENQAKSTTTVSSSDSGMVSAMNDQTRIMEKQLRLQRLENSRYLIRKGNYMMKYGKVPDW